MANSWQVGTKDKDKALVAKQIQIEQAHVHEEEMRKQRELVAAAEKRALEAKEESLAAKAELKAVQASAAAMQAQIKDKFDTQVKFSVVCVCTSTSIIIIIITSCMRFFTKLQASTAGLISLFIPLGFALTFFGYRNLHLI